VEVSCGPLVKKDNSLIGSFVILHDVTDRNRLAREFKTNEEKYESVLRSNLDTIVAYDNQGRVNPI
jgi:hypothetical protein